MQNLVPECVVEEAAEECIQRVKRQLLMILYSTSKSSKEQREALDAMHTHLKKLKDRISEEIQAEIEEYFLEV